MAWTDFFTKELVGSKVVVDSSGKPFVSKEIAPKEYVEIELNIQQDALPYNIFFPSLRCDWRRVRESPFRSSWR